MSTAAASIATGFAPPHSLDAEMSVLGGVLLSDRALPALIFEEGLLPEHFYRERHRIIWAAMVEMHAAADGAAASVDVLTLTEHLRAAGSLEDAGGRAAIDELTGGVPGLGGIRKYAQIVIRHWRWRGRLTSTYEQQHAISQSDEDAYEAALGSAQNLTVAYGVTDGYLGRDALADHMMRWLEEKPEEGLPLPGELPSVAKMVRLRAGHVTVVAAWPSGGKTAMALELAASIGAAGHRVVFWTNEDTAEELVAKHVMAATGVPAAVVSDRRLSDSRMKSVLTELGRLPFEVQPCHDWSAAQVASHIRQVRPAVAIVDHFHNLSGIGKVTETDEAIRVLAAVAGQAGCHLILCAQLNRNRMSGVCKPPPVAADLRGSGMFLAAAHTLILVHRDEEEIDDTLSGKSGKATQLATGSVDIAKNKVTGKTGIVRVSFDARRLRFIEGELDEPPVVAGSAEDLGF